jgi:hypothetical protein
MEDDSQGRPEREVIVAGPEEGGRLLTHEETEETVRENPFQSGADFGAHLLITYIIDEQHAASIDCLANSHRSRAHARIVLDARERLAGENEADVDARLVEGALEKAVEVPGEIRVEIAALVLDTIGGFASRHLFRRSRWRNRLGLTAWHHGSSQCWSRRRYPRGIRDQPERAEEEQNQVELQSHACWT